MSEKGYARLATGLFAAAVLWVFAHVEFGWPSGDEGWYLYAARELLRGRWPYVHYFFTQGPLTPLIMAAAMAADHTLEAGRTESALCFLLALWLGAAWLHDDRASGETRLPSVFSNPQSAIGNPQSMWWFLLIGVSTFIVYMCTLALTTVYEMLAVCLTLLLLGRGRRGWAVAIAALACAVRISLAPWALAVWLYAASTLPAPRRVRGALVLALLGGGLAALAYAPFAIAAPERLREGLFGYHLGGGRIALSAERAWEFRGVFWSQWIAICWPVLAAVAAAYALTWRRWKWDRRDALLLGGALALTIVHSLPSTPYPKYQVTPTALLALAAARRLAVVRIPRLVLALVLAVIATWQVGYYWTITDHLRFEIPTPPARHRYAARMLTRLAQREPVLTFDTLLAVEGRLRVPPGYEMGPFALTVSWDDARAAWARSRRRW